MKGISVFLPMYNEERILSANALKVYAALKKLKRPFELVLVDDGSTDGTFKVAQSLAKRHKEIKAMRFTDGPSRRENLGKALHRAKHPLVAYIDIDLAVDLSHLADLVRHLDSGAKIAIGSRYKGVKAKREASRKLISVLYNNLIGLAFGSKVKDHQCGFKGFDRAVLMPLLKEAGHDKTGDRGWFWDAEMLIRAQRKGIQIVEFPVSWQYRKESSFNVRRELRIIRYALSHKL